MAEKRYKIVVYVPGAHAEVVRKAMGDAGAGVIGTYTHCSFSMTGVTRFMPGPGSDPAVGEIGELVEVNEDRIETVCSAGCLKDVLDAVKRAHPYEEPAMDVYPIELF